MPTQLHTGQKEEVVEPGILHPGKVCMHVLNPVRMDARVMRSATALAATGYAVTVVDVVESYEQETEEINGIFVHHVKVVGAFTKARFKKWAIIKAIPLFLRSILLLLRMHADFYHAHDATALPACFIAARLLRKPLIFDAHELPLSELDSPQRRWTRILLTPLLSRMISSCAGGIGACPFYAQELRERYHVLQVSLVRNFPPYKVVPMNNLLQQQLGFNSDTRIALYQGYLQYGRGLDRLVQAAAFLDPNIVIVMMGKGRGVGDASSYLKALIAREKVSERVKIVPHVQYEKLLDWTVSADIGLITYEPGHSLNIQMCLPNKLFEFLMAGVPVLTSPLDAVIDVVKTYNVGQVLPSLKPAEIGAAINAMLAGSDALVNMRHNALEAAQCEFNWESENPSLIRLYQNIKTVGNRTQRGYKSLSSS